MNDKLLFNIEVDYYHQHHHHYYDYYYYSYCDHVEARDPQGHGPPARKQGKNPTAHIAANSAAERQRRKPPKKGSKHSTSANMRKKSSTPTPTRLPKTAAVNLPLEAPTAGAGL